MSNNLGHRTNETLPVITGTEVVEETLIVSYAQNIKDTRLSRIPFQDIVSAIQLGSDSLEESISRIRTETDPELRRQYKAELLPYFSMATFHGNKRRDTEFESARHIVFDCDHIGNADQLTYLQSLLKADSSVYCFFVSPSGDGVKVIFPLDSPITNAAEYKRIYSHYQTEFEKKYSIKTDKTIDPARACFLSYDPEIYVNTSAVPLALIPVATISEATAPTVSKRDKILESLSSGVAVGSRTRTVTQFAGVLRDHGIDKDFALELVRPWNKQNSYPLPDNKLEYTVNDIYDRYNTGSGPLANYWSYGSDILEIGVIDNKFFMERNPLNKVYIRSGSNSDAEKAETYRHLVTRKHIPHLARIDFLGDVNAETSYYTHHADSATISVHYAAIPELVRENDFIEKYLENVFGEHKRFIKEWLSVYCYTNYTKLPYLVLTGDRGDGKNTFAEMVSAIFPTISWMWKGEKQSFNPECEMKLLVADETVNDDPKQYKLLKEYSGTKEQVVNQKYLKPYKVKNNMNIMILSNAKTPIFVERDEMPTSERNNQFFVYRFKKLACEIDPALSVKLTDRLGHYIRTELKRVFGELDMAGNRYAINVPITREERSLFANNTTEEQLVAQKVIDRIKSKYLGDDREFNRFLNSGYLIHDVLEIQDDLPKGVTKLAVLKVLVECGVLKTIEQERKYIGRRETVYLLTAEFLEDLQKEAQKRRVKVLDEVKLIPLPLLPVDCQ